MTASICEFNENSCQHGRKHSLWIASPFAFARARLDKL